MSNLQPVVIESRVRPESLRYGPVREGGTWRKCGVYESEREARAAMARATRKQAVYEYRIASEAEPAVQA